MQKRTCSIDGCDRAHFVREWCRSHYAHWRRWGDPVIKTGVTSFEDRFWAKVAKGQSDECWLWTASVDNRGYGKIYRDGGLVPAHRVAYELCVEPIPAGLYVDHMCFVKGCVNPQHLRLATPKQNIENQAGANRRSKSGIRGVSQSKRDGRWVVFVGHAGKRYNVGSFEDIQDAEAAAIAKRNEFFTHNLIDRASLAASCTIHDPEASWSTPEGPHATRPTLSA